MGRPTTKIDLVQAAGDKYNELLNLINSLPVEKQEGNFDFDEEALGKEAHWKRDKNLRDVLVHLYEWHQLFLNWVDANQKGEDKKYLPDPYNWKTYGDMNVELWKKHQNTSYERAKELLDESHHQVMHIFDTFTNEELFSKGVFKWAGNSPVGSYGVSATASHYDWAIKKVKKYKKLCK